MSDFYTFADAHPGVIVLIVWIAGWTIVSVVRGRD